jgi:lipoprotein-anchoring transpeptidase ErfK/SrfK
MTVRSWGLVAAALLLTACGGHADARVTKTAPPRVVKSHTCKPGLRRLGSTRVAYVGVVQQPTRAFRRPGRAAFARFGLKNVNGVETVFGVTGAVLTRSCRATWYHVQLPMRPNGVSGYVRARDLWVTKVRTRIEVDVSTRQLSFFRRGRLVLRARVAVGSGATPTPFGRFYVNQRLIPTNPNGPYGPGAIGISAFSNVLTGWTQGGPVAIHGTNEPLSIGRAVSNGCVRLPNAVLLRLFRATPAGTPVVVHP